MLSTFLGLFSACLLPTITLLVNGMTASGRSVHAIERLDAELRAAMDALLFMFGNTALAFAALLTLSIHPPSLLLERVPLLTAEVLPRLGQAVVVLTVAAIVVRAGQIPGILRRALASRKEIAVEEAKRKLAEQVPDSGAIRTMFLTDPEFGRSLSLDDLKGREH